MGFGEAVNTCLKQKFVTFKGRASRSEYWWFYLFLIIIWSAMTGIFLAAGGMSSIETGNFSGLSMVLAVVFGVVGVALYIPLLAVMVRRFHDRNLSGWWVLAGIVVGMIPILGYITGIIMLVITILKGTEGDNKFGPDPLVAQNSADVFA